MCDRNANPKKLVSANFLGQNRAEQKKIRSSATPRPPPLLFGRGLNCRGKARQTFFFSVQSYLLINNRLFIRSSFEYTAWSLCVRTGLYRTTVPLRPHVAKRFDREQPKYTWANRGFSRQPHLVSPLQIVLIVFCLQDGRCESPLRMLIRRARKIFYFSKLLSFWTPFSGSLGQTIRKLPALVSAHICKIKFYEYEARQDSKGKTLVFTTDK